jgi:hypothetical protein
VRELPYDDSRCYPQYECSIKENCARFTSPGDPLGQWQCDLSQYKNGIMCTSFIDNKKNKED